MSEPQPSDEELRAALEEQMRRITVQDVLLQTVVTLINLSARRLGMAGPPEEAGEKDVQQAKLGIDAARALLPVLPAEEAAPVRDALSQLQVAFAQEVKGAGPAPAAPEAEEQTSSRQAEGSDETAERAKARSKIWTPPGS